MGKFLTTLEVAEKLNVTDKTVRVWIETGVIVGYRVGKNYRITEEDLNKFITESKVEPSQD